MSLSRIDDGSVRWLWMRGVVGDSHLGSGLMCLLMRRRISMAKSCICGERVWFSMGLWGGYRFHSHAC